MASSTARDFEKLEVGRLAKAIRQAWSAETSADEDWTAERPSLGQCAVTALVVQDYLGGESVES